MMSSEKKVAVVTGGSSGIGLATAKKLLADGYAVYELSRREPAESGGIVHVTADVTSDADLAAAAEKILAAEGHVDALVCCAGFGISGASELTPSSESSRQLDVNVLGAARTVCAFLPAMREAGRGNIVFVSSVAGVIPIPFQSWYSASKAAINAYALALRSEVAPFGVKVSAVMPGDASTGFTDARKKMPVNEAYAARVEKSVSVMEHDERNGMSPASVAALVAKTAERKNPAPLYTAGFQYKVFTLLIRLLPRRFASYLVGKIYGG